MYSITINDGPLRSLEGLGLSLASIALSNMAPDVATLTWQRGAPGVDCPVADEDMVGVWRGDRRLFYGRAKVGSVSPTTAEITVRGPWSQLERYFWHETHGGTLPPGAIDIPDLLWTSRTWIFPPAPPYLALPAHLQAGRILDYVRTTAAGRPARDYAPAAGITDLPVRIATKRSVQDLRISDALRQTLVIVPDSACWFDYDVLGAPKMNLRGAATEVPRSLTVGQWPLMSHQLDPMPELVPAGVFVGWEDYQNPVSGRGQRWQFSKWPSSILSRDPGVLVVTLQNSAEWQPGIARDFYEGLSTLRTAGSVTVADERFDLGLRPGMVLDIAGDAELERYGAQHWVQGVQWQAATGQTTLTCGYPEHLGLRDILDVRLMIQRAMRGAGYLANT